MKTFRFCFSFFVVFIGVLLSFATFAAERYDRDKICKDQKKFLECDILVEKVVAADVPGIIDRVGLALRIRVANGKALERKGADPKSDGEGSKDVWACDYLPAYGYVRLCYRFWEKAQTEYINLETGDSVIIKGFPHYSPSGQRAFFINHYVNTVYGIEIWRFDKNRIKKEFDYSPPAEFFSETGKWENENEIILMSQFSMNVIRHRIVKGKDTWTLQNP